jgi:hypothetical protein
VADRVPVSCTEKKRKTLLSTVYTALYARYSPAFIFLKVSTRVRMRVLCRAPVRAHGQEQFLGVVHVMDFIA